MTTTPDESKPLLTFPCDFVVKIFGAPSDEFENTVIAIITKHYPDFAGSSITRRPSKDGKYVAYSISVHVNSQEHLDNIYRDLTSNPLVLMAL
jgi:putative lipoic acid-binding regulatory protein